MLSVIFSNLFIYLAQQHSAQRIDPLQKIRSADCIAVAH